MRSMDAIVETIRADDPRFGDDERRYVRLRVLLDKRDWREYTRHFYKSPYLPQENTPLLSDVRHPSLGPATGISGMFFCVEKMLEQLHKCGNSVCISAISEFDKNWSCVIMSCYEGRSWSLNNAMEQAIDLLLDDGKVPPLKPVGELACQS